MSQLLPATTEGYVLREPKLLIKQTYRKYYYFTMKKVKGLPMRAQIKTETKNKQALANLFQRDMEIMNRLYL